MSEIYSLKKENLITAAIIVGKQPEPHFADCLESIADSVDCAVIDYNGENPENWQAIINSRLYRQGLIEVRKSTFTDYASARNNTLEMLPENTGWIMRVDADEVHYPERLKIITKDIIPSLKDGIGMLDAYWLCFFHSFKYVRRLERRHDLFIRYHKGMHWERIIHEKLIGRQGRRCAAPYIFHHYAAVKDPEEFMRKERAYKKMTDQAEGIKPYELADDIEGWFEQHRSQVLKYAGDFPALELKWLKHPDQIPQWLKNCEDKLANMFKEADTAQRGGRMRILFRLLPLLAAEQGLNAKKQTLKLASYLKNVLK